MLYALYTASAILTIGIMVFLVLYLIFKKKYQAILCTECQQCKAACPLLYKGCNPMDIMLAVKSGLHQKAMMDGAGFCVGCAKCEKACPRGLAPYLEVEKWRVIGDKNSNEMNGWEDSANQKAA